MMIKYNEKGSSLRHKSCYYMGMVDLSLKSPTHADVWKSL